MWGSHQSPWHCFKKKERKKDGRLAGILLESRFAAEQACEQASEGVRKARRRELADNSKLNYCDGNKMASFRGGGARGGGCDSAVQNGQRSYRGNTEAVSDRSIVGEPNGVACYRSAAASTDFVE